MGNKPSWSKPFLAQYSYRKQYTCGTVRARCFTKLMYLVNNFERLQLDVAETDILHVPAIPIDIIEKYLNEHPTEINMQNSAGWTALMLSLNKPPVMKLLMHHEADPNVQASGGVTALMMLVRDPITEYTLEAITLLAADPTLKMKKGVTALMILITRSADLAAAKLLVNSQTVNQQCKAGRTPLIYAITCKKMLMIRYLLECGADPNLADKTGKTPLMYATDADIISVLLGHGANIHLVDKYGCTAFIQAVLNSSSDACLELLLKAGANINHKDDGETVLEKICDYCIMSEGKRNNADRLRMTRFLLERGAVIGRSALIIAYKIDRDGYNQNDLKILEKHSVQILLLLLEHGADVELADDDGDRFFDFVDGSSKLGLACIKHMKK